MTDRYRIMRVPQSTLTLVNGCRDCDSYKRCKTGQIVQFSSSEGACCWQSSERILHARSWPWSYVCRQQRGIGERVSCNRHPELALSNVQERAIPGRIVIKSTEWLCTWIQNINCHVTCHEALQLRGIEMHVPRRNVDWISRRNNNQQRNILPPTHVHGLHSLNLSFRMTQWFEQVVVAIETGIDQLEVKCVTTSVGVYVFWLHQWKQAKKSERRPQACVHSFSTHYADRRSEPWNTLFWPCEIQFVLRIDRWVFDIEWGFSCACFALIERNCVQWTEQILWMKANRFHRHSRFCAFCFCSAQTKGIFKVNVYGPFLFAFLWHLLFHVRTFKTRKQCPEIYCPSINVRKMSTVSDVRRLMSSFQSSWSTELRVQQIKLSMR